MQDVEIYFLSVRDEQVIAVRLVLRETGASRIASYHTRKFVFQQKYYKIRIIHKMGVRVP